MARAVGLEHPLAQRFARRQHDIGAAHRAAQQRHEARNARLAETLEVVVQVGDPGLAQARGDPCAQRDVGDVGRGDH